MLRKINSLFASIIVTFYFAAPVYSQDAKLVEAGKKRQSGCIRISGIRQR